MSTEHFRFSTEILKRLGEEIASTPDQGILELVRNSYDADAGNCEVKLVGADRAGGEIVIQDDGVGLSTKDIRSSWLVIGSSEKRTMTATPERKRMPIGSKGIGRLAALRLGTGVILTSRPKTSPKEELRVAIDWEKFDRARTVEDVNLTVTKRRRQRGTKRGTTIQIRGLRQGLTENDVSRLAKSLIMLSDPFSDSSRSPQSFTPKLLAPEFENLESLVKEKYFSLADFHLRAELQATGESKASLTDGTGRVIATASHADLAVRRRGAPYDSPAAHFDFWVFLLRKGSFAEKTVTLKAIKDWIKEFGGVHLYHRGLRVSPYSDFDWLNLNLRRSQNPEERASTNTSIGQLRVSDPTRRLHPKTDRVGFIEDRSFSELKSFAVDTLEWLAKQRLKRREKRRESKKRRTAKAVAKVRQDVEVALSNSEGTTTEEVISAIRELETAHDQHTSSLEADIELYRMLSTVGAAASVFAHQTKSPLSHICASSGSIAIALKKPLTAKNQETLRKMAEQATESARAVLSFSGITLSLLQHEKRRRGNQSLHKTLQVAVGALTPFVESRGISVRYDLQANSDRVFATQAALEMIFTNLSLNSMQAFERTGPGSRLLEWKTRNDTIRGAKWIACMASDSGPGISGVELDDIWLPGVTTTLEGTGLGLTIVKDTVTDLGGTVEVVASGALGGAEFTILLPLRSED